jgi:hypothetical protein
MSSGGNIRVVKYNEDLFKSPSRTQKRKKPDKPIKLKPAKKVSNKSIKNSILKEIRKNQERKYNALLDEPSVTTNSLSNDFENDFKDSVEFMKKIADKQKETHLNQTIKNHNASVIPSDNVVYEPTNLIPVHLEPCAEPSFDLDQMPFDQTALDQMPFDQTSLNQAYFAEPMKILPRPDYGCLKNGSLPTYRAYHNKTMKAVTADSCFGQTLDNKSSDKNFSDNKPLVAERMKSPTEILLIEKLKQREMEDKTKNQLAKQKKYKKLLRRTYRVGRDRFRPKVGVLLPNKTIRTNVTTKSYLLKQTPIEEIRKTLVKQGFIKVGSSAPNDVLRKIYESIKMIDGDIKNHNPDNLLYNFFNDKNT